MHEVTRSEVTVRQDLAPQWVILTRDHFQVILIKVLLQHSLMFFRGHGNSLAEACDPEGVHCMLVQPFVLMVIGEVFELLRVFFLECQREGMELGQFSNGC